MCRWIAYRGQPTFLETLVCAPAHSLVAQALHADEAKSVTNGDGFGVGWYGARPEPGLYREILPAWSDENLRNLCRHVQSPLFFAHVRASTGAGIARANCHPFVHGRHMFMHNGQIGGFHHIRRQVEALIPDALYLHRAGSTDTEALFLALLGRGLAGGVAPAVAGLLAQVSAIMRQAGLREPLRFTAALTDGEDVHAFRWASDGKAPSLYWREEGGSLIIVSEPLDARDHWREVPQGGALAARRGAAVEMTCLNQAMRAAA